MIRVKHKPYLATGAIATTGLLVLSCTTMETAQPVPPPMEYDQQAGTIYIASEGDVLFIERQPILVDVAVLETPIGDASGPLAAGTVLSERYITEEGSELYCSRKELRRKIAGDTMWEETELLIGPACFYDGDMDNQFERTATLITEDGNVVLAEPAEIPLAGYRIEEQRLGDSEFEYVVTLEQASASEVALNFMVLEQFSGCAHRIGTKRVDINRAMPVPAYLTPPRFVPHVADNPNPGRTVYISPPDEERRLINEQRAHKIVVLGWSNEQLKYQFEINDSAWEEVWREGFSGCDDTGTDEFS